MPKYLEHEAQWMPTKDLHQSTGLNPDLLAEEKFPEVFDELVAHFLTSGESAILDYIGYPGVQRSLAEEMATDYLSALQVNNNASEQTKESVTMRTQYVSSSEPTLFHAARTYGVDNDHFYLALDTATPEEHAQAMQKAVFNLYIPHAGEYRLTEADAPYAVAAMNALHDIVQQRNAPAVITRQEQLTS